MNKRALHVRIVFFVKIVFLVVAPPSICAQRDRTEFQLLQQAQAALLAGDFVTVRSSAEKVLKRNPKNFDAYFFRGFARFMAYELGIAVDDFSDAIRLAPRAKGIDKVYNLRGSVYALLKKEEMALIDFDKAIQINSKNADPYVGRGNMLYNKGDFDKAFTAYEQAILLNPTSVAAYLGRADIWFDRGKFSLALQDLNRSLQLSPNIGSAHLKCGIIYGLQGHWLAATSSLDKGIQIEKASKTPLAGNTSVTLSDFDKFLIKNPRNARAYSVRGLIQLLKGLDILSQVDFDRSFEIDAALKQELEPIIASIKEMKRP